MDGYKWDLENQKVLEGQLVRIRMHTPPYDKITYYIRTKERGDIKVWGDVGLTIAFHPNQPPHYRIGDFVRIEYLGRFAHGSLSHHQSKHFDVSLIERGELKKRKKKIKKTKNEK